MNAQPRPRRGLAARLLAVVFVIPVLAAACSAGGGGAANSGDPAAVVERCPRQGGGPGHQRGSALACAGQADKIKTSSTCPGSSGLPCPASTPARLASAVHIDTSGVKVGTAAISGDTATVPVTGSMKMTFDKAKLLPIFKQVMAPRAAASR